MALPQNRKAVLAILDIIEPRILGKTHEGFTCSCGEIHCTAATAVEVEPAGDSYPGQEKHWYLWSVKMAAEEGHSGWSCGISEFIDSKELKDLFERHFTDQSDDEGVQYRLATREDDRVHAGLPAAVRINENRDQIRFSISLGREQEFYELLLKATDDSPRRMPAGSHAFNNIVALMRSIIPETYLGGPEPELPFESTWHLDYESTLNIAAKNANHIFLQGGSSVSDYRGSIYTGIDIVFMKYEVK